MKLLRALLVGLLGPTLRGLGRLRVQGLEQLPSEGPWMLACNHPAFVDSFWVHLALPVDPSVVGAHPRLFASAPKRALMALGKVRRVDDDAVFHRVIDQVIGAGEVALVYPEGGRRPQGLGDFGERVCEAAGRLGCPVVPAWIAGTYPGQRGPVELRIGTSLRAPSTHQLRAAIAALGTA